MKTIVLDDDPTGTQSASDVLVLFESSSSQFVDALREADSVYLLTNSRAITEADAVSLMRRIRVDAAAAGTELGEEIGFVLRGDSTLRGHVFAETEVFLDAESVILFAPAFPDGGRTTEGGVHFVSHGLERIPAHLTEFAEDPVFAFSTAVLVDYVRDKSGRTARSVPLFAVRAGKLEHFLLTAEPGSVIVPDAVTNADVRLIASAVEAARVRGASVVVRGASPLAAALAGVESSGLLSAPLVPVPVPTLLVCGSHTVGATAQLDLLAVSWGPVITVPTGAAFVDPEATGGAVATSVTAEIASRGFSMVATERERSAEHNTLDHGRLVMKALTSVVQAVLPRVEVIVSKGGITSAEVARVGIGASRATVLGQVLAGVSVWKLVASDGRELLLVVVPGNVGENDILVRVLDSLGLRAPNSRAGR